eukprot:COSAG06_NODE_60382_length_271_cov_0.598837_1_plen_23_part_10
MAASGKQVTTCAIEAAASGFGST